MRFWSLTALALLSIGAARADILVSTFGFENGSASPWGTPDSGATPTYGQAFTVPLGALTLSSVAFKIDNPSANAVPYQAYVYAWTGTGITGGAKYSSAPLSITPTGGVFTVFTVSGINLAVLPGDVDVILFSTIGFTGPADSTVWDTTTQASYSGGKFVYNNATTFAGLSAGTPAWNQFGDFGNTSFQLDFTGVAVATPEPGTYMLLSLAFAGLALLRRARR